MSGNGMGRNQQDTEGTEDRTQRVNTQFSTSCSQPFSSLHQQCCKEPNGWCKPVPSPSNLRIDLSVSPKLEPNRLGSNAAGRGTYVVCSRLTNQGNQPISILYPRTHVPWAVSFTRIARILEAGFGA